MDKTAYRQMVQWMAEQPCQHQDSVGPHISCATDPCRPCLARVLLLDEAQQPGWHCPACGTRHDCPEGAPTEWPFRCDFCQTVHYCSPKPVVALIVPAWSATEPHKMGIVVIRRGIEPHKGELAFPGGYIDYKEDWRHAAAREFQEELGVWLDPKHFSLRGDPVTTRSNFLVLFAQYSGDILLAKDFRPSVTEVQEVLVLNAQDKALGLGVPAHNTVWKTLKML